MGNWTISVEGGGSSNGTLGVAADCDAFVKGLRSMGQDIQSVQFSMTPGGHWALTIDGIGAHDNGRPDCDADYVAKVFVDGLKAKGQNVEVALFSVVSPPRSLL
jgi:hypothetical protein